MHSTAKCTNCNQKINVDEDYEIYHHEECGTDINVNQAIKFYNKERETIKKIDDEIDAIHEFARSFTGCITKRTPYQLKIKYDGYVIVVTSPEEHKPFRYYIYQTSPTLSYSRHPDPATKKAMHNARSTYETIVAYFTGINRRRGLDEKLKEFFDLLKEKNIEHKSSFGDQKIQFFHQKAHCKIGYEVSVKQFEKNTEKIFAIVNGIRKRKKKNG